MRRYPQTVIVLGADRAIKKLESIKVIHAHGSLGPYPQVKYGLATSPHSALGPDYLPIDLGVLKSTAERLRLVGDSFEDSPDFIEAQEAIDKAERILFVGFGYDDRTVKKLFRGKIPTDKIISGTYYNPTGITKDKLDHIKAIFDGKIELLKFTADTIMDVFDFYGEN